MRVLILLALVSLGVSRLFAAEPDVVVFGGTPAGVMAAVTAGRQGNKVLLLEPGGLVGGMMAGGLTKTDMGRPETVGGLANEYFARVLKYYQDKFGVNSAQAKDCHNGVFFEPHVAGEIFAAMLQEAGVEVRKQQQLVDATVKGGRITEIAIHDAAKNSDASVTGKIFIDATYEGDLLAAAHVPYRVGREARSEFHESMAGLRQGPPEYLGTGDHRVMAYNIRSPITNVDALRAPVPKPQHYTPELLQSFVDAVLVHKYKTFEELFFDWPNWGGINGKFDSNRGDFPGANYAYLEGDYEARAAILARVQDYFLSLWWMLQNDPRLPEDFRQSAQRWGLPKDEFLDSGHISPQLYVREGRRMLGRYFITQDDLEMNRHKDDAVCIASYNIDSHTVQQLRYDGRLIPEEGYFTSSVEPWEIPYRALTPYAPSNLLVVCAVSATHIAYGSLRMEPIFMMIGQVGGLAADLALRQKTSVQDIPVKELQTWLTHAGIPLQAQYHPAVAIDNPPATVAVGQPVTFHAKVIEGKAPLQYFWNFDGSGAVQSTDENPTWTFPVAKPTEVSLKVLDANGNASMVSLANVQVGDDLTPDPAVNVRGVKFQGRWDRGGSLALQNRHRENFHDMNEEKGAKSVLFSTVIPRTGRYLVAFAFQGGPQRATNTPVAVTHRDGEAHLTVNQRTGAAPFAFQPLGEYRFEAGAIAKVVVSNENTDGFVSVDEVRWIWLGP